MSFRRSDFPMLRQKMHGHPLIYLDSAATSLKPQSVIDSLSEYYSNSYSTINRAIYSLAHQSTQIYHSVRIQLQNLIKAATPAEIIFTKGTTESINLVAYSFGEAFIRPGDEILISLMEHHSNIVPWQLLSKRKQAILKYIPLKEDHSLDLESYKKLLSPKTKLVAITHISNVLGIVNPIKEIIEEAHKVNAKVLIDGAQSVPHIPIDVEDLDCDFLAFSGHKIYGPTGVGVLYGKWDLLEQMPPFQSGGDMIETVSLMETSFQKPPFKFESGTPMIGSVIGLGAAINYLLSYPKDQLILHETSLFHEAFSRLQSIDKVKIIGAKKREDYPRSLISFTIEGCHPFDVATLLDLEGIALRSGHICAQPLLKTIGLESILRISWAPYNSKEEIVQCCTILKEIVKKLGLIN